MTVERHYLAADLGASSGRTIVGTLDHGKLTLREINRFWNGPVDIRGTLYWDFVHIFRHIREGITLAQAEYGDNLVSMGVDTWGVDFGLFCPKGNLLRNPVNYRDNRTVGMMDEVFKRVPREEVFARTGVQFMELNTLYQLMSLVLDDSFQYRSAATMLFSPDIINYWLTGNMVSERTIASTSQFYDPVTGDWARDLLDKLGIRCDLFADLVDPGTVIGEVDDLPVVAVGSHDTASAYAAVPVEEGEESAFLSSGTWSLLGTEESQPIINAESLAANFTNEVGVCNTIRFLKNLSGLWIVQELRRVWNEQGFDYSFAAMENMAREAEPFGFFIDPSDESFIAPGDMFVRIGHYCERMGQHRPETHAQALRAAYEGLALLYASSLETHEQLTGRSLQTLRIVGGGCQDALLNQLAADATGRRVITGPVEATAIGNVVVQMLAMGDIRSLAEGRAIVRVSFDSEANEYEPLNPEGWSAARQEWHRICRARN